MWDLANQFVAVALTGGLLTLIFYIAIFKRSFADIGTARKLVNGDRKQEWFLWCMGSTLFATIVASFGINSVPQILMGLFALLACISVTTFEARQAVVRTAEGPTEFAPIRGPGGTRLPLGSATQKAEPIFSAGSGKSIIPSLKA